MHVGPRLVAACNQLVACLRSGRQNDANPVRPGAAGGACSVTRTGRRPLDANLVLATSHCWFAGSSSIAGL